MNTVYQYQSSIHFISNLEFDYLETYSLKSEPGKPTPWLIDDKGAFHHTSQKINTFRKNSPQVKRLTHILRTEIVNVPSWVCAPVYRDAVVFFNAQHHIVSALNICLSCEHMAVAPFSVIEADEYAYRLLRHFFAEIGHVATP